MIFLDSLFMVKHIVLFKLNISDAVRSAVIERFCDAIRNLPVVIETIRHVEVSDNINSQEQYDIALVATFDTLADVRNYAVHPAHLAAARLLDGYVASRACVDYEI